jgi:hypothetical protein
MLADGNQVSSLSERSSRAGCLTTCRFGARTAYSMCSTLSSKSRRSTSLSSRNSTASLRLRSRKLDFCPHRTGVLIYRSEIVGDYGSLPLYHMLGYFSLIGLLRVHVLLGDFTLALKVVENVELNQKVSYALCCSAFFDVYSVLFLESFHSRYCLPRRNVLLRGILLYHATPLPRRDPRLRADSKFHTSDAAISHTKLPVRPGALVYPPHQGIRSYGVFQINKTADRMYALFAICNALSPSRLDDNILNIVKDRYGDQFAKLSRGCVVHICRSSLVLFPPTETKACPRSKSSSSTRAPSSSPPIRRRTMTQSSSRRTQKIRRRSPRSVTSRCSWLTCARRRLCRHSAASSNCTRRSTRPSSRASSMRMRRRWCSR